MNMEGNQNQATVENKATEPKVETPAVQQPTPEEKK
jgi:hypothetical protein